MKSFTFHVSENMEQLGRRVNLKHLERVSSRILQTLL